MAFRANESEVDNFERACRYYLSPKYLSSDEIREGREFLQDLTYNYGPVIDTYPTWHPLVSAGRSQKGIDTTNPGQNCGYERVDHLVCFRNAFISCPYDGVHDLIKSVEKIRYPSCVFVEAHELESVLYHPDAKPVIVKCEWEKPLKSDGTIPQRSAIALMVENEFPHWTRAEVAETWDTMKSGFLGTPCGSRSSLFVNQKTGQAMKSVWEALINGGVFGPIAVDR